MNRTGILALAAILAAAVSAPAAQMATQKWVTNYVENAVEAAGLATDARLDSATNAVREYADMVGGVVSRAAFETMEHATNALWAAKADREDIADVAASLSGKADASALADYATSNDLSSVATSVSAVWEQVFGDSVWIAVTNYMRSTDAKPSMGLWEKRDGQTNLVWSSAEEVDAKVDALRADVTNGIQSAQTAADSAKAWGRWQSADGSAAPDGFTAVSTPYLMLTGGGHWEQRTVGGGGSYWLFCGNGSLGGADEAFKMMDSSGESVFEVTQGGVREVAAIPSSFTAERKYDAVLGSDYMDVSFGVYATSQPKIYSAESLDGPWREEEFASWSCSDGTNYVASMLLYPDPTRFFRAVYETGAESVVDFRRPLKFPKLSLGGTNYAVSVGVMSDGTKFLKLEGE